MNDQVHGDIIERGDPLPPTIGGGNLPFAFSMFMDDALFQRAQKMAKFMAAAQGVLPKHLIGKEVACFAVLSRALTWRLDPFAVAQSTYETPGGAVGYEGKLCMAILERSGHLDGGVRFEHYGDWTKVKNKFQIITGDKGFKYPKPTWTDADAADLGVIVRAKVRGEPEPREMSMDLVQCWPRNSTLWATDPKTQICYTAVRRFASLCVPALMMGVPFDAVDELREIDMGDIEVVKDKAPANGVQARARAAVFSQTEAKPEPEPEPEPEEPSDGKAEFVEEEGMWAQICSDMQTAFKKKDLEELDRLLDQGRGLLTPDHQMQQRALYAGYKEKLSK